ncbi:DNA-binding transcription repressor [Dissophora globulifera]|nr:DNA-binding transcription repressor [Dissophora globulifera]
MASEASLNSSGTIYEQRYNSSYSPAPTSDMRNFKFPADDRRSQTPPSPALPPTSASLSPVMQVRSKRKSSIPMRSPSVGHSREDDASPGVIFQLPFGTPPIPSTTAFRKASTPSMLSLSVFSAQEAGSTEDNGTGLSSDHLLPENYPSPASSRVNFVADHQRSEPLQEQDQHDQQLTRFETPPSPANRSGLGIQVQESFTEPGATHPLEPASTVTEQQQDSQAQQITFIEGDSSMSIGDIIVAEQHASAAAAQRRGEQPPIEVVEGVGSDQTPQPSSMPTPPPTSRVLPTRVMEANSQQRQESPHMDGSGNRDDNSSRASPPTPFTPAYGFSASHGAAVKNQRVVDSTLTQNAFKASVSGTTESSAAEFIKDGLDQRSSRASSKTPSNKDADQEGSDVVDKDGEDEDDQDQVLDPLGLPLWAQRHLHIRRQSLIPRPELDFVKGSGILPPASKGLVTSGGAVILSYPVLISDMVHVALDDLQAKGVALDGSDASEESEEDAEQPSASSTLSGAALKGTGKFGMRAAKGAAGAKLANHKRRKGIAGQAGKRRGSSAMTAGAKDEYNQSADEYAESEDIEERTQGGGGFMSTAVAGVYNKRRRAANNTKSSTTDAAEALMSVPTRVVPERHGPSVYRRRGSVNGSGIYSPSASPQMGYSSSAASFRQNYSNNNNTGHSSSNSNKKRLGSPVDIDTHYAFEGDGDVVMNELEDEGDDIDIEDEYDGDQHLYSGESYHHRHHHVPEHLRIPPSEVEIAVKLTKEMMESNKRRKLNGKKDHRSNSNHNNSRSALKTLKPLLDATTKADQRRAGRSDDEDEDEDEDEDNNEDDNDNDEDDYEADHRMVQVAASVKTKAGSSIGNGQANTGPGGKKGAKANSNTASGLGSAAAAGASLKQQRAPKSREGKMMTKRCEACGTTETPCWRPGYTPHSALCNSCGLRYKKSNVFCPKVGCKYIPLKTEYAAMEAERTRAGRAHLMCHKCKGPVALPVPKE